MPKRQLIIVTGTLLIVGSMVSFLLYLDSIPGSRIPTRLSPEILQSYPDNKSDAIELKWTYEFLESLRGSALALSPDGNLLVFMATGSEQCSVIGLNDKGKKLWVSAGLECYPHKDLLPRIVMDDAHIVIYWVDSQGGIGDDEGGTTITALSTAGKKLWSKQIWGIPHLIGDNRILISKYKQRLHYGWDEEPVFPAGCIDPEVISTAGGDAKAYDIRDRSVVVDIETGTPLADVVLPELEAVSKDNNYFITSCIGKTTVYDKRYNQLFAFESAGPIAISPDERYFAIQRHQLVDAKQVVEVYSLAGGMAWRKESNPFFMGHEEEIRGDKGFVFLSDGSLVVLSSAFDRASGRMRSTDVTVTAFDNKGNDLWSKKNIDGFSIRTIGIPHKGRTLIVLADDEKGVEVDYWPNTRLNEMFRRFGICSFKMHEHLSRLYALDYRGSTLHTSGDIISSEIEQLVFSANGERIVATAGGKISYFVVGHNR